MCYPKGEASELDPGTTTWYKRLAKRWGEVVNLIYLESPMPFRFFKRKNILPLDYRSKQRQSAEGYVAMFDDGTPLRRRSVPDDNVVRGNLSYNQFVSIPRALRSPED